MKIVRTYKEAGELWGETADGAKIRWDAAGARWDHSSIQQPSATLSGEGGAESRSALLQILGPEGGLSEQSSNGIPSLGPIDEAWNKRFPAWSGRRLLFFLAAFPFVGLLHAAWRKLMYSDDFNWSRYLFVVVVGSIFLTAVFAYQWWKGERIKQRRRWAPSRLNEILIATVLFFVGLAGSMAMVDASGLGPLLLAMLLGVSALISVLLQFRLWMIMAALLSAAAGFVISIFLTLFNTFMGGSTNVLLNWLAATGFVFLFIGPMAWGMKVRAEKLESRQRIPTWVIAALVCVFMLFATGFTVVTEGIDKPDEKAAQNGPPHLRSTTMSPRITTQMLVLAWQKNSRMEALNLASPEIVDQLFTQGSLSYQGCGYLKKGGSEYRCMVQTSVDVLILEAVHTDGGFYIGKIDHAPLGTKLY